MSDVDDGPRAVGTIDAPDGDLPHNARKEHFSLAFVRMVVAAAGCSIKAHETDYDGVDITIASSAEYSTFYCPDFELQVKCTTRHDLLTEEHLAWPMEASARIRAREPCTCQDATCST
ncbi:DUF4365 domain-containing protein [Umezawaea endophytica]|uniref:DUF4365 domain-containing protein n=1 Tax=Umezawaea endophytica TaxID=1654476 RepID=A0A9X2VY00_9PSEU|nr:DUF4365 domain-containing protein [Umezawaea endophytica]MCS7484482.1 DUF4365 domain-containing protein [Umezawaea endophytica]